MKYTINKNPHGLLYTTEEDVMKLNYRCKKEEQQGEGPGSCGGKNEGTIETGPDGKKYSIPANKDTGGTKYGKIAIPNNTTNTKTRYEKVGMIGAKSAIKNDFDISRNTKDWGNMTPEQKNQFVDASWEVDEMGTNVYPEHPELEPKTPEQEKIVKESFKKNLMSLMDQRYKDYVKRYGKKR